MWMYAEKIAGLWSRFRRVLPRKTRFAAVDVGAGDIKVVELDVRGSRPAVTACGRFPAPPVNGDDWEAEALPEAIYSAVQEAGLKLREVYTTVGGEGVFTRHVKVPALSPGEMKNFIRREAEKFLPLPLEEITFRLIKLGEELVEGKRHNHVLLAAVPAILVRRYYEMFIGAGLLVTALELHFLSLWRVFFGFNNNQHRGTVAVLNIGARTTQLLVVRDGRIRFTRTVPAGGDLLTRAVADNCGLDFDCARRLKEEKGGLLSPEKGASPGRPSAVRVDFSLQEGFSELLGEIRRSLDFYQAHEPSAPIERFVLSGGTSKLKGIREWFSEALDVPVELGGLPALRALGGAVSEASLDLSFAVALGTALREVV